MNLIFILVHLSYLFKHYVSSEIEETELTGDIISQKILLRACIMHRKQTLVNPWLPNTLIKFRTF